jgi:hypothetical protein
MSQPGTPAQRAPQDASDTVDLPEVTVDLREVRLAVTAERARIVAELQRTHPAPAASGFGPRAVPITFGFDAAAIPSWFDAPAARHPHAASPSDDNSTQHECPSCGYIYKEDANGNAFGAHAVKPKAAAPERIDPTTIPSRFDLVA